SDPNAVSGLARGPMVRLFTRGWLETQLLASDGQTSSIRVLVRSTVPSFAICRKATSSCGPIASGVGATGAGDGVPRATAPAEGPGVVVATPEGRWEEVS